MMGMVSTLTLRRAGALTCTLLAMFAIAAAVLATHAFAYTGPFCSPRYLTYFQSCTSSQVTNIRRAVGHGAGFTYIDVSTQYSYKTSTCNFDGCTADTRYLSRDGTGNGYIRNEGGASGNYYGYLYP